MHLNIECVCVCVRERAQYRETENLREKYGTHERQRDMDNVAWVRKGVSVEWKGKHHSEDESYKKLKVQCIL